MRKMEVKDKKKMSKKQISSSEDSASGDSSSEEEIKQTKQISKNDKQPMNIQILINS